MSVSPVDFGNKMRVTKKRSTFVSRLKSAKSELVLSFFSTYRRFVMNIKKYLVDQDTDFERRRSQARLKPPPDRPLRRVVNSKLHRKPTNELERLRKKGEDWTANDLFRFQYGDPEEGEPEERKQLCYEWLERLNAIPKKYCYLAWYASAIYACYYRLAPLLAEQEERVRVWEEVKREYAEIFVMGRRIWRRPIHPSRLHVFYDFAMLCVRFGNVSKDPTISLFRNELKDATNFDFKVLDQVQYAHSIDKIVRLENHVIDQFYSRRRSTCSSRSSFRSRRSTITDHSPTRKDEGEEGEERPHSSTEVVTEAIQRLAVAVDNELPSLSPSASPLPVPRLPKIVVEGPAKSSTSSSAPTSRNSSRPTSRKSSLATASTSLSRPASPKPTVRFAANETARKKLVRKSSNRV